MREEQKIHLSASAEEFRRDPSENGQQSLKCTYRFSGLSFNVRHDNVDVVCFVVESCAYLVVCLLVCLCAKSNRSKAKMSNRENCERIKGVREKNPTRKTRANLCFRRKKHRQLRRTDVHYRTNSTNSGLNEEKVPEPKGKR